MAGKNGPQRTKRRNFGEKIARKAKIVTAGGQNGPKNAVGQNCPQET